MREMQMKPITIFRGDKLTVTIRFRRGMWQVNWTDGRCEFCHRFSEAMTLVTQTL